LTFRVRVRVKQWRVVGLVERYGPGAYAPLGVLAWSTFERERTLAHDAKEASLGSMDDGSGDLADDDSVVPDPSACLKPG
jgi:hypothetical protein